MQLSWNDWKESFDWRRFGRRKFVSRPHSSMHSALVAKTRLLFRSVSIAAVPNVPVPVQDGLHARSSGHVSNPLEMSECLR